MSFHLEFIVKLHNSINFLSSQADQNFQSNAFGFRVLRYAQRNGLLKVGRSNYPIIEEPIFESNFVPTEADITASGNVKCITTIE